MRLNKKFERILGFSLFILVLLITFLVYYSGLSGDFIFDDYPYIANNKHIKISELNFVSLTKAALGANYNSLGRPISMISFGLNYYFTGLDPYFFKLWNLIIHLTNGICVLFLTRYILRSLQLSRQPALTELHIFWISLFSSSIWLLHPINLTSVLYAAQRMTSLTTIFIFSGLILFLWGRIKLYEGKDGTWAIFTSLSAFTFLATLCKENGILLIYYALVIEIFIFQLKTKKHTSKKILLALYFPIALSIIAVFLFITLNPEWLSNDYLRRDFTLYERLLTECRAIFFYLRLIILPDLTLFGLFHDDFVTSTNLFTPFSTFFSVLGILFLIILVICIYKKATVLSLGLAFFLIGHSMESSFLSLELIHEHRNYFPCYGIILIAAYYIFHPKLKNKYFTLRKLFIFTFIFTLSFQTYIRSTYWSNTANYIVINAQHHPESERSISSLAQLYADMAISSDSKKEKLKLVDLALSNFHKATELSPSSVNGLLNTLILNNRLGLPTSGKILSELLNRLKKIPISDNTSNQIAGFENRCHKLGRCNITPLELRSIFDSILSNPTLIRRSKSNILMAYAQHLLLTDNDENKALELVLSARETYPSDIHINISAISLFIKLKQKENALQLLEETKKTDIWNIYEENLRALNQQITLLY